jgi:thiosulfate/3-mercaptopyruvate sulfurtransferase
MIFPVLMCAFSAMGLLHGQIRGEKPAVSAAKKDAQQWSTLIRAETLHRRLDRDKLLIVDVRSEKEYATGHIPGAINLPGSQWRTPATKPESGKIGQQIFRREDGSFDVARYEKLLGNAGITPDHEIVVYGNYAGKADGSVPAAILLKLGHKQVAFLDGVGTEQWQKAGYKLSTESKQLPAAKYTAHPDAKRLWSFQDVVKNLDNKDVVIVDSRTPEEFAGKDLRGNQRGGHIPGAKLLNSEDFLDAKSHTTISTDEARKKIEAVIPKGKTVVIYCQTGTRCSHKELILRDLGYENVVLYDASWQEWGNRTDTPIAGPSDTKQPAAAKE